MSLKTNIHGLVALLFAGSAILLCSCESKQQKQEEVIENILTEECENLTLTVSENGRRSYKFSTPLLEGYTLGKDPYREFRKGIKITTYSDDEMAEENATLTANYAIYYEKRKLWEAKGNVRIIKTDGTKVFTQQLFWDSSTKRIFSNVDTKVETESDVMLAEGFEADENMDEIKFRHWNGKVEFDDTQINGSDSLQVDSKPSEPSQTQRAGSKSSKPSIQEDDWDVEENAKPELVKPVQRPKPARPKVERPQSPKQDKMNVQAGRM